MKDFGLLTYPASINSSECKFNIGDYIQSLAAFQFIKTNKINLINREQLNRYNGIPLKIILNGWFMHNSHNWPPAKGLLPLFISFHLNVSAQHAMEEIKNLEYFKRHEPIGCRDYDTLGFFQRHNIKSYYSGCLTLTLGRNYINPNKTDDILIVDPIVDHYTSTRPNIKDLFTYLIHFKTLKKIGKKYLKSDETNLFPNKSRIKDWIRLIKFYRTFKGYISKDIMTNATYLTHFHKANDYPDDSNRFKLADELIQKYASAKYVITSRIHCALPCLGLGTPVIYIQNTDENKISKCRLNGISDLFLTSKVSFKECKVFNFPTDYPLTVNSNFSNPTDYEKYEKTLWETCINFIEQENGK